MSDEMKNEDVDTAAEYSRKFVNQVVEIKREAIQDANLSDDEIDIVVPVVDDTLRRIMDVLDSPEILITTPDSQGDPVPISGELSRYFDEVND